MGSFVYWWLLCGIFCGVCVVAVGVLERRLMSLSLFVLIGMKWCVLIWVGFCVVSFGCFVNMVGDYCVVSFGCFVNMVGDYCVGSFVRCVRL